MSLLKIVLSCVLLLALPAGAQAETRALLVGVSAYQHLDASLHLSAPRNDVVQVRELLIKRGVKSQNITILTDPGKAPDRMTKAERDRLPTRRNIMDALAELTKSSTRGDFAIVYMSGHGSHQPDQLDGPDRDEEDGRDEVFLPYDVEVNSPDGTASFIKNGIIDDELGKFAAAIRDRGVDLWFTLDSCHSGTGVRASGEARTKFIDPATLGIRGERDASPKDTVNFGDRVPSGTGTRSGPSSRGKAAFLYASQADEKAAELPVPLSVPKHKATYRSAFTHGLVMALARQPTLTYRQVVDEANRLMREFGGREVRQTAGQDGDLVDVPVVGSGIATASPEQWAVYDDRIAAGILHGVEKGAIVALFAGPNAPKPKGHAEVISAAASESRISPIREFPCPFINGNPKCRQGGSDVMEGTRYARLVAPPRDYALGVSSPRPARGASAELEKLATEVHEAVRHPGQDHKELAERVRFDGDDPDLVWWVTDKGFRLMPAGVDPALFMTGAGVPVAANDRVEHVAPNVVRLMLRAYRVERLRRLADDPQAAGADQPQVKLSVNARSSSNATAKCPAGEGAPIKSPDGASRAGPCSVVAAEIKNVAITARIVHVFSIDADWNIRQRCTTDDTGGTGAVLAPGASRPCEIIKYGKTDGPSDPGIANVARYALLVLSTPRREGTQGASFASIEDLNNSSMGSATKSPFAALSFDDDLTSTGDGRRASGDRTPPTIAMLGWEVDQRDPR